MHETAPLARTDDELSLLLLKEEVEATLATLSREPSNEMPGPVLPNIKHKDLGEHPDANILHWMLTEPLYITEHESVRTVSYALPTTMLKEVIDQKEKEFMLLLREDMIFALVVIDPEGQSKYFLLDITTLDHRGFSQLIRLVKRLRNDEE